MIDIHCHLEFMENPEKVVEEAKKRMTAIVTSIADPKHFDKIIKIRDKNPDFVFVTVGLHPTRALNYSKNEIEDFINRIRRFRDKIVGIGEVGLDFFHIKSESERELTKKIFIRFIELANETSLPLVIHARDCMKEVLEILKQARVPVVLHFFSGDKSDLEYALKRDYWISFTTMICNSKKYRKLAKATPLEKMLLETDSPWLDPDNTRSLTNRPWKIERSAEVIAKKIKKVSKELVIERTTKNAKMVFGI